MKRTASQVEMCGFGFSDLDLKPKFDKGWGKKTRIFKKRKWPWRENRLSKRAVLFRVYSTNEYYKL